MEVNVRSFLRNRTNFLLSERFLVCPVVNWLFLLLRQLLFVNELTYENPPSGDKFKDIFQNRKKHLTGSDITEDTISVTHLQNVWVVHPGFDHFYYIQDHS